MTVKDLFRVGDTAYLDDRRLVRRVKVSERKETKRGVRLTLTFVNGETTQWDLAANRPWGTRGNQWDTSPNLRPWSPELEARHEDQGHRYWLKRAMECWDDMPREHRQALGARARLAMADVPAEEQS